MAYVYLVMTAQIPQREFELVVAPDVAAASKLGIVMLLTGEADDHEVDARLGGPAARRRSRRPEPSMNTSSQS